MKETVEKKVTLSEEERKKIYNKKNNPIFGTYFKEKKKCFYINFQMTSTIHYCLLRYNNIDSVSYTFVYKAHYFV